MSAKLFGAIDITDDTWTDVYTVPEAKVAVVSKILLTNNDTADAVMSLAHLPSGQAIASKYYIIPGHTVLKNGGQIEVTGGICLTAGDKLQAKSDQSNGTCIAWGDES